MGDIAQMIKQLKTNIRFGLVWIRYMMLIPPGSFPMVHPQREYCCCSQCTIVQVSLKRHILTGKFNNYSRGYYILTFDTYCPRPQAISSFFCSSTSTHIQIRKILTCHSITEHFTLTCKPHVLKVLEFKSVISLMSKFSIIVRYCVFSNNWCVILS